MRIVEVEASAGEAVVALSSTEVRALRNLLSGAHLLPLELKGPPEVFGRLHHDLSVLVRDMGHGEEPSLPA
jgi:hypothetical protein